MIVLYESNEFGMDVWYDVQKSLNDIDGNYWIMGKNVEQNVLNLEMKNV
jgi:hypothetical protein